MYFYSTYKKDKFTMNALWRVGSLCPKFGFGPRFYELLPYFECNNSCGHACVQTVYTSLERYVKPQAILLLCKSGSMNAPLICLSKKNTRHRNVTSAVNYNKVIQQGSASFVESINCIFGWPFCCKRIAGLIHIMYLLI